MSLDKAIAKKNAENIMVQKPVVRLAAIMEAVITAEAQDYMPQM